MYVQLAFVLDRVKALAPQHPDWKSKQPFQAVLEGDMKALAASGEKGLGRAHGGDACRHDDGRVRTRSSPTGSRPRATPASSGPTPSSSISRCWSCSPICAPTASRPSSSPGGGIEFMRPWAERVYGIPPEQVVGSSIKTRFEMRDGRPTLFRLPEINFIDDKAGKPVGINEHIGRRPIAAFGNSDGDLEMLQWTTMTGGVRFGLIVHHTDAEREYAYDRQSHFGKLDKALDAAALNKWTVVDMKNDWKRVFAFQ